MSSYKNNYISGFWGFGVLAFWARAGAGARARARARARVRASLRSRSRARARANLRKARVDELEPLLVPDKG